MRRRAAPVRWRQYLCRAGSAHNWVEAASIAAAMTAVSIGPSWSTKVDYAFADAGVDGEAAPILGFRGIATDARASSFADIRTRRVHRPNRWALSEHLDSRKCLICRPSTSQHWLAASATWCWASARLAIITPLASLSR
jgi:hypothetical protein